MPKGNDRPDWEELATEAILLAGRLKLELDRAHERAKDAERRHNLAIALMRHWKPPEPKKSRGGRPRKYSQEMIAGLSEYIDGAVKASGGAVDAKAALFQVLREHLLSEHRANSATKKVYDTVMRFRRDRRVE